MAYPLAGVRVVDLTRALAGPIVGRILSDLGAEVVKVEPPPRGDITRAYGNRRNGLSGYYTQQNAGKKGLCVDLNAEGGADLVRRLADRADVLVENFRPGVMDRFGLGWEALHARNPRLVMLSISGFGQEGPERDRAAYAPVLHAETGLLDRQAIIEQKPPHDIALAVADTNAGLHGMIGLLAALLVQRETGRGQHIDMAMLNAQLFTDDYSNFVLDGAELIPGGGVVFDMPGGGPPLLIAAQLRFIWRTIGEDAGLSDGLPADAPREEAEPVRRQVIGEHLRSLPDRAAVIALLDRLNLAWGEVKPWRTVYEGPSVGPRRLLADIDDRAGGTRPVTQSPYHFSDSEAGVRGPAPYRGEHNRSVLRAWLDASDAELAALEEGGVLVYEDRAAELR